MTEVAALGLLVEGVKNVDQAARSLDGFVKSGRSAESTADRLSDEINETTRSTSGLSSAQSGASKTSKTLSTDFNRTASSADKLDKNSVAVRNSLSSIADMAKRVAAPLLAAFGTTQIVRYADEWTNVNNQIRQVVESESELTNVRRQLLSISRDTNSELDSTVSLYSELYRSTRDLGTSQQAVADVTRTINNLFLAGGKSAAETAGAVRQLAQGFAAGALRGDEFNSVAEGAPRIMDALALSLNMSRGELREFAAEGGITAEIMINALQDYSGEAQRMADITERTFGQQLVNIKTNTLEFVGALGEMDGRLSSARGLVGQFGESIRLLTIEVKSWDEANQLLAESTSSVEQDVVSISDVIRTFVGWIAQAEYALNRVDRAVAFFGESLKLNVASLADIFVDTDIAQQLDNLRTEYDKTNQEAAQSFEQFIARLNNSRQKFDAEAAGVGESVVWIKEMAKETARLGAEVENVNVPLKTIPRTIKTDVLPTLTLFKKQVSDVVVPFRAVSEEAADVNDLMIKGKPRSDEWLEKAKQDAKELADRLQGIIDKLYPIQAETRRLYEEWQFLDSQVQSTGDTMNPILAEWIDQNVAIATTTREAADAQALLGEAAESAYGDMDRAAQDAQRTQEQFATELFSIFSQSFDDIGDAFDNLLKQIGNELYKSALGQLFGMDTSTPILSGLFGGSGGGLGGLFAGGGRAARGTVADNALSAASALSTAKNAWGTVSGWFGNVSADSLLINAGTRAAGTGAITNTGTTAINAGAGATGFGSIAASAGWGALIMGAINTFNDIKDGMYEVSDAITGEHLNQKYGSQLGILGEILFPSEKFTDPLGIWENALGFLDNINGDGLERVSLGVLAEQNAIDNPNLQDVLGESLTTTSGLDLATYTVRAGEEGEKIANTLLQGMALADDAITGIFGQLTGTGQAGALSNVTLRGGRSAGADAGWDDTFFGSADFNQINAEDLNSAMDDFIAALVSEFEEKTGQALDLDAFDDARMEGELLADALVRIYSNANAANTALEKFGFEIFDATEQGLIAADDLVQAFGDANTMAQALQSYSNNFVTEAEKLEQLETYVAGVFGELEIAVPQSREAFAALVGGLDKTTESGRETFAALVGASNIMAQYYTDIEQSQIDYINNTKNALMDASAAIDGALDPLRDRVFMDLLGDPEQQYGYLQAQADQLASVLENVTDPAAIQSIVGQISQLGSQAYGLLDEEGRQERGAEFIQWIDAIQEQANAQLQKSTQDTTIAMRVAIRDSVRESYAEVTNTMVAMLRAANNPDALISLESVLMQLDQSVREMAYTRYQEITG